MTRHFFYLACSMSKGKDFPASLPLRQVNFCAYDSRTHAKKRLSLTRALAHRLVPLLYHHKLIRVNCYKTNLPLRTPKSRITSSSNKYLFVFTPLGGAFLRYVSSSQSSFENLCAPTSMRSPTDVHHPFNWSDSTCLLIFQQDFIIDSLVVQRICHIPDIITKRNSKRSCLDSSFSKFINLSLNVRVTNKIILKRISIHNDDEFHKKPNLLETLLLETIMKTYNWFLSFSCHVLWDTLVKFRPEVAYWIKAMTSSTYPTGGHRADLYNFHTLPHKTEMVQ